MKHPPQTGQRSAKKLGNGFSAAGRGRRQSPGPQFAVRRPTHRKEHGSIGHNFLNQQFRHAVVVVLLQRAQQAEAKQQGEAACYEGGRLNQRASKNGISMPLLCEQAPLNFQVIPAPLQIGLLLAQAKPF
jgi:hypothetical protein